MTTDPARRQRDTPRHRGGLAGCLEVQPLDDGDDPGPVDPVAYDVQDGGHLALEVATDG